MVQQLQLSAVVALHQDPVQNNKSQLLGHEASIASPSQTSMLHMWLPLSFPKLPTAGRAAQPPSAGFCGISLRFSL
jgi:hypothetical protein